MFASRYLVFHGGSGSTKEEIATAVSYGVVKMNVDTDTQFAYLVGIRVSGLVRLLSQVPYLAHRLVYSYTGLHHEKEGVPSDSGRKP